MMNSLFIDTHTHLYYHEGTEELDHQMERSLNNKVHKMILPNVDVNSIEKIFSTVQKYPDNCFAMMGLHPCSVKDDYKDQLYTLDNILTSKSNIKAVGEIGIDLYWDPSTLDIQTDAFITQLNWAKDLKLPVSIHCREAYTEVINVLEKEQDGRIKGVLHCFTGNPEQGQKLIDLGFSLGVGGVVTFKNSDLGETLKNFSLKNLVLETDSPYLAPVPFRGKPNESSYIPYIAEKLAEIFETSIDVIAEETTKNAELIFQLS